MATSEQARELAAAVGCAGGSFEVEWRGSVAVPETIYVADGTVLAVTGADSSAVVDGGGSTRLFTVVNASVRLSGINVTAGSSTVGGAIAASGSSLTLDRTNLVGNSATINGGAVYAEGGSAVSCAGSTFSGNTAAVDGGGMFVAGGSAVSCGGLWTDNTAGDSGGGLCVFDDSHSSWGGEDATFVGNAAGRLAGAVYILNSTASWDSSTLYRSNYAAGNGGALVATMSQVTWSGEVSFERNVAGSYCGALCAGEGSQISWSGATRWVSRTWQRRVLGNEKSKSKSKPKPESGRGWWLPNKRPQVLEISSFLDPKLSLRSHDTFPLRSRNTTYKRSVPLLHCLIPR